MKLGAEDKKKVYILAGLGAIALYSVWSSFSGPSGSTTPSVAPQRPAASITASNGPVHRTATRTISEDWHPSMQSDGIDPTAYDPTLKLGLLAKLQDVPAAGTGRNLFSMSQAPAPELPKHPEPVIAVAKRYFGPPPIPAPAPPPGPPPPPPLPPITFKYYGIATVRSDGSQTAFFLDGENIIIRSIGDTVAGTYKLVRIGSNSAIVEDIKSKRQQTVPLAEEAIQG
jgi:hypothetical protein